MPAGSGRWLVNGSPDRLVELTIEPPRYTGRKPVSLFTKGKVNALTLSLADPDGFIAALQPPGQRKPVAAAHQHEPEQRR